VRITITEVLQRSEGKVWLAFSSKCGEGTVQWVGDPPSADKGRSCYVEFDILISLEASMLSHSDSPLALGSSRRGDDTVVRGILEAMDDDGMGCLRISRDCRIMVEARLDSSSIGRTLSMQPNPAQLHATPYDL